MDTGEGFRDREKDIYRDIDRWRERERASEQERERGMHREEADPVEAIIWLGLSRMCHILSTAEGEATGRCCTHICGFVVLYSLLRRGV